MGQQNSIHCCLGSMVHGVWLSKVPRLVPLQVVAELGFKTLQLQRTNRRVVGIASSAKANHSSLAGSSLQSEAMTPRKMIHRLHSLPGVGHFCRPPLHLLPHTT